MTETAGVEATLLTSSTDTLEDALKRELFKPLTLNDRCDSDSSESAVAQVMTPGGLLLFCGHHFRLNYEALKDFPHQVPDNESRPFTERRTQELGAPAQRDSGSAV